MKESVTWGVRLNARVKETVKWQSFNLNVESCVLFLNTKKFYVWILAILIVIYFFPSWKPISKSRVRLTKDCIAESRKYGISTKLYVIFVCVEICPHKTSRLITNLTYLTWPFCLQLLRNFDK
jgi:hypothetical protein